MGIGRVQYDMQARIQSSLEAFSLFLVNQTKKTPLHLIVSRIEQKNISTLKYAFLIQMGLIILIFFRRLKCISS